MRELCRILGIQQNISTAYHPRTDGQSEQTNQWLETYLRFFVNYQQDDWVQYLPLAEFAHNNWKNATTGESPFYLLMGSHLRADWEVTDSAIPQVTTQMEQITEARRRAQEAMTKAQNLWIKHANTVKYQVGDQVWLDGRNLQVDRPTAKLAARCHGPFKIEKVLSPLSYQLTLPHQWRIHLVFHVDLLAPYKETEFHGWNYTYLPPDLVEGEEQYEVERVLDSWTFGRRRTKQYLIKWKGYPHSNNQWADKKDMNAERAIREYEEDKSQSRKGGILHQSLMSQSPISIRTTSSDDASTVDLSASANVAKAQQTFPTPEPGRLSPDSMFSVDLDLDPATHIDTVGVDAEVSPMEERTDTGNVGGAVKVSPEVVSRCVCSLEPPDAGPCICRGYHCPGTSEATCAL